MISVIMNIRNNPSAFSLFTVGRWSQETGSDNEMHPHKISSPGPLPHPDLTDNTYLNRQQGKMNMPPSLLENIQETYNMRPANGTEMPYDNDRYKYDMDPDHLYGQGKDYQANYGDYPSPATYLSKQNLNYTTTPSDAEYPNNQIINQVIPTTTNTNHYLYDKQRAPYMGSKTELSYMSKERLTPSLYNTTPRESHYGLKSPALYSGAESVHSVHSMLKNDYQVLFYSYNTIFHHEDLL